MSFSEIKGRGSLLGFSQIQVVVLVDRHVQISPEIFVDKCIHLFLRCLPHVPPHLEYIPLIFFFFLHRPQNKDKADS